MQLCPLLSSLHGAIEISRRHDDEGVASAELEHDLLELARTGFGKAPAGVLASREGGGPDARVGHQVGDRGGGDQESLEGALGKAGFAEDFLDRQRAARDVRGVLEQARVSDQERGRREAEHLPIGEVPRHHGQHGPDRVEADMRFERPLGRGRLPGLGSEPARRVLGMVPAEQGALAHLIARGAEELPHFERRGPGQLLGIPLEDLGSANHASAPFLEPEPLQRLACRLGTREPQLDLRGRGGLEAADQLSGGRVPALDGHAAKVARAGRPGKACCGSSEAGDAELVDPAPFSSGGVSPAKAVDEARESATATRRVFFFQVFIS
jgi:hypothetical protein